MPYIRQEQREKFSTIINELTKINTPENPGEINFLLSVVCNSYLLGKEERYQLYNDLIGALESCKMEIYRRLISKFEDKKIIENGEVFVTN